MSASADTDTDPSGVEEALGELREVADVVESCRVEAGLVWPSKPLAKLMVVAGTS